MELKNMLRGLCMANGVNGYYEAAQVVKELLSAYTDELYSDALGNVWGVLRSARENAPTLLLEAHIDEVGFTVTKSTEDGFLRVAECGGVDNRALSTASVTVLSDPICHGVFTAVPPHLSKEGDPLPDLADRVIDIGRNPKCAVPIGTRVAYKAHFEELLNNRVCSKALDNRAGVASVLWALELLKNRDLPVTLVVAFCTQEELGLRGAKTVAFSTKPDAAVVVDVSFAATPDSDKNACGELGKGAMLGISPILDENMTNQLRQLAMDETIPFTHEVMGSMTGTHADVITVTGEGIPTALLSVPLRYMHTPNEVVCLCDLEAVARLIAAYVCQGEVPHLV